MVLSHAQEKIVRVLENKMMTAEGLAQMLGKEYSPLKAQSMVLTLAQRGYVDKTKAALILKDSPMIKFLNYKVGSGLKGGIPKPKTI